MLTYIYSLARWLARLPTHLSTCLIPTYPPARSLARLLGLDNRPAYETYSRTRSLAWKSLNNHWLYINNVRPRKDPYRQAAFDRALTVHDMETRVCLPWNAHHIPRLLCVARDVARDKTWAELPAALAANLGLGPAAASWAELPAALRSTQVVDPRLVAANLGLGPAAASFTSHYPSSFLSHRYHFDTHE